VADLSGERFESLRDHQLTSADLPILARADHIVLTVDGERISDTRRRHSVVPDLRVMLRSMSEAGLLRRAADLTIAITKWDVVKLSGKGTEVYASEVAASLADERDGAKVIITSARSATAGVRSRLGVSELLQRALHEAPMVRDLTSRPVDSSRRIDHFRRR
jgi:hypothetical protein